MFLGEIIKTYRDEHGLSMQDFSSLSKLSKPYISQLEKNRNPKTGDEIVPSPDTFQKVANAMGISFDELIRMVDENQPMAIKHIKSEQEQNSSGIRAELISKLSDLSDPQVELLNQMVDNMQK